MRVATCKDTTVTEIYTDQHPQVARFEDVDSADMIADLHLAAGAISVAVEPVRVRCDA